jgi:uncharacterized protein YijF (DUF1287 family)
MKAYLALLSVLIFALTSLGTESASLSARVVKAARQQIGVTKGYDPAYRALKYPGGDVPLHTGVCTDVVVRAIRGCGLDLQRAVHEDMRKNFGAYPKNWGLKRPDKNIDHRRVPNLMRYFERHHVAMGEKLKETGSYRPGDIVAWNLGGGVLHIGVVLDKVSGRSPLIIHNIGGGAKEENVLLKFEVIGHYRLKEDAQKRDSSTAGSNR